MDRISWKSTFGLALAAMACLMAAPASAGITYNVTNDTAHQNGWSLNGTITLSGTGTFSNASAITAWNITASNGGTSRQYISTFGTANTVFGGSIFATANELRLGNGSTFHLAMDSAYQSQLRWTNNGSQSVYKASWANADMWLSSGDNSTIYSPSSGGVWTLASGGTPSAVPEIDPATSGSALSLVAGVLAMIEQRRRRAMLVA
jgi:hypothetical protein